jgi:hypothetical protein
MILGYCHQRGARGCYAVDCSGLFRVPSEVRDVVTPFLIALRQWLTHLPKKGPAAVTSLNALQYCIGRSRVHRLRAAKLKYWVCRYQEYYSTTEDNGITYARSLWRQLLGSMGLMECAASRSAAPGKLAYNLLLCTYVGRTGHAIDQDIREDEEGFNCWRLRETSWIMARDSDVLTAARRVKILTVLDQTECCQKSARMMSSSSLVLL